MMKAQEYRQKSSEDLNKELIELNTELFKLKMQKGMGQVARPHAFKQIKRQVARIKTILNERVKSA